MKDLRRKKKEKKKNSRYVIVFNDIRMMGNNRHCFTSTKQQKEKRYIVLFRIGKTRVRATQFSDDKSNLFFADR